MTNAIDLPQTAASVKLVTAVPGPKSLALAARRTDAVPRGVSSSVPVFVQRAHGAVVEDVDGNRM